MAVTLAGGRPRVGGGRPPAGLWRNLLLGGQSWACLVPRPAARAVATGRGEGSRRKVEGAGGRGGRREEKERNEQGKAGTSPSHRLSPSLPLPCGQLPHGGPNRSLPPPSPILFLSITLLGL